MSERQQPSISVGPYDDLKHFYAVDHCPPGCDLESFEAGVIIAATWCMGLLNEAGSIDCAVVTNEHEAEAAKMMHEVKAKKKADEFQSGFLSALRNAFSTGFKGGWSASRAWHETEGLDGEEMDKEGLDNLAYAYGKARLEGEIAAAKRNNMKEPNE